MERWRARSHQVRFWRRALPWTIVGLVALVIGWILVRTALASLGQIDNPGVIRMVNPHFFGRSGEGRPFSIRARDAVRDPADPDRVTLNLPSASLQSRDGQPILARADTGVFLERQHSLRLSGHVLMADGRGYRFRSDHAAVDTATGVISGDSHVIGDGPLGHFEGSSYSIREHGDQILVGGGVRAHIVSH